MAAVVAEMSTTVLKKVALIDKYLHALI